MKKKAKIFVILFISLVIAVGILPLFAPPRISDLSYVNWNGEDLSKDIEADEDYLNETFEEFNQPNHLFYYSVLEDDFAHQVTMTTLQGLVNKDNTSLFIQHTEDDEFWFLELVDHFNLTYTNLTKWKFWDVIDKFKDNVEGLSIWDEDLIDSVNVATFLASLDECLVITKDMEDNCSDLGIDDVEHDLRNDFDNKVDLYEWAWEEYGDKASRDGLFSLDADRARMRDYVIATKCFAYWLVPGPFGPKDEIMLYRRILEESPENIPVWGWHPLEGAPGEYENIRTVSHAGKYMAVGSWPNPTVFSAFHIPEFEQTESDLDFDDFEIENKIYVSFIVSDGDNIRYCYENLLEIWDDKDRGDVPVGITISPLLYKLNPIVLQYFYDHASENELFVCPPSGAGYCYPDMNPATVDFLSQTQPVLEALDMDYVWLLNGYEAFEPRFSDEMLKAYTSDEMGLKGVFLNYHDFQVDRNRLVNDVPILQSLFVEQKEEINGKLKVIESTNTHLSQPVFVYIAFNSWNTKFEDLSDLVDELDSDVYEILRPDDFCKAFKQYELNKEEIINEEMMFLLAGLIPFIASISVLAVIWIKLRKSNRTIELLENEEVEIEGTEEKDFNSIFTNLIYISADIALIFIIKYLLYVTNLTIFYLVLFLLGIAIGVLLKNFLGRNIGTGEGFIIASVLVIPGLILFAINYQMLMALGLPLGIILGHQFQNQKELFENKELSNRAFLYSFMIALAIVNLIPRIFNEIFKWIIVIAIIAEFSVILYVVIKKRGIEQFNPRIAGIYDKDQKIFHLRSLIFAFFIMLLLFPMFAQERYYYHLIWGLELAPSKMALQFAISTIFIAVIILFEVLRLRNITLENKQRYILCAVCVGLFIGLPYLLRGVFVIYLIFFSLIVFTFIFFEKLISSLPDFIDNDENVAEENERQKQKNVKGYNMLMAGMFFWAPMFVLLFFVPPVSVVVDTYNIFEKAGLLGIIDIKWSPFFYMLFYTPSIYIFIMLPFAIYCFLYGAVFTIQDAMIAQE